MCAFVENRDLMFEQTGYSQSLTHSRPAERGSRQAIQVWSDNSNRVVASPRGLSGSGKDGKPDSWFPEMSHISLQSIKYWTETLKNIYLCNILRIYNKIISIMSDFIINYKDR